MSNNRFENFVIRNELLAVTSNIAGTEVYFSDNIVDGLFLDDQKIIYSPLIRIES